jgi:hypothetical protein
MSSLPRHGVDTAKGNLSPEEWTAVANDAKFLLGRAEVILYGFRTVGVRQDSIHPEWDSGKLLFTTQRIVFCSEPQTRGEIAYMYPYAALVSVSFPFSGSQGRTIGGRPLLKFRDVDCSELSRNGTYMWIYVMNTSLSDIRHLSAATLCMDRVPSPYYHLAGDRTTRRLTPGVLHHDDE